MANDRRPDQKRQGEESSVQASASKRGRGKPILHRDPDAPAQGPRGYGREDAERFTSGKKKDK